MTFPTIDPSTCEKLDITWKGIKWSKILYRGVSSVLLRVNVANNDLNNIDLNNEDYIGLLHYNKKNCGINFIKGWLDGKLKYNIFDNYEKYRIMNTFVRIQQKQTQVSVQFKYVYKIIISSTLFNSYHTGFILQTLAGGLFEDHSVLICHILTFLWNFDLE